MVWLSLQSKDHTSIKSLEIKEKGRMDYIERGFGQVENAIGLL